MSINRRQLLQLAAGGSAALAGPLALRAADDEFPMSDLEAHVRMRGNLRGERTYWYYSGTIFGNRWGEVTRPMLRVEGVSFSTIDSLPDGHYRYNLKEAGYYADFESGEIRDRVLNPFTMEYYTPEHYLSPQKIIFAPDLSVTPDVEKLPPGLEYRGVISPLRRFQDQLFSSEDLFVRMPAPAGDGSQPDFRVQTSLAMFSARASHVLDANRDFVPCQFNYQTLATFRDWMGMGADPGMMSWRMVGTKCKEDDLPRAIHERIAGDHAGFFA